MANFSGENMKKYMIFSIVIFSKLNFVYTAFKSDIYQLEVWGTEKKMKKHSILKTDFVVRRQNVLFFCYVTSQNILKSFTSGKLM